MPDIKNMSGEEMFEFVRSLLWVEEEVATNRKVYGGFYPRGGMDRAPPAVAVQAVGPADHTPFPLRTPGRP